MINTKTNLKKELIRVYHISEIEAKDRIARVQKNVNEYEFDSIEDIKNYCFSEFSLYGVDWIRIFCKCRLLC